MNKKYLSVILFGAMLMTSTGTFVSCKDYDDDIDNLQEQIDSQKSDLSSQLTTINGAISDLQSAKDELELAIKNAKDDAEKAADAAQQKAIETAKAELETVQAELQALIKANTDDIKAVKDAANKAEETMAKVIGRVETLEAFKTTTESALAKLSNVDAALNDQIKSISAELKDELITLGKRLTAVETQIEVLNKYKTSNEAAVKGNQEAINQLITDLNTLKDSQEAAITKYDKAVKENKDAASDNKAAIDQLKANLLKLENGQLTEAKIKEIAEQVTEEVGAEWDLLSAALNKMVTHVSLYATNDNSIKSLNLVSAKAVRTYIFGQGLAGEPISFTKDAKETWEDSFIIRVSPTNATLNESMIRLVNSEMKDLNGLLNIEKIEPYTGLLTTRGISANGLWKVSVKLVNDYDEKAYETAATYKKDGAIDKPILYAVMINDNAVEGSDETREVVSEYGITLSSDNKAISSQLSFNVDNTPIKDIRNRWSGDNKSNSEDGTPVLYTEYKWKNKAQAVPTNDNEIADTEDARNDKTAYNVKSDQTFTVNIDDADKENIRGFYVGLDTIAAVESAPSEFNAWKSYKIEGLNTVTSSSSIELTIPGEAKADGDYIGFRVYAVNYDGSLVDPDGKAFYIYVGETAQNVANLTLAMDSEIVTPLATTVASGTKSFSTANWARAEGGTYELTIKAGNRDLTEKEQQDFRDFYEDFVFTDKEGKEIKLLTGNNSLIGTEDITKVANVQLVNVDPAIIQDHTEYTAQITAKNPTSGIVAIATIKFSKQLPSFPAASVYPFTNILVNQNLKIYPVNDNDQAEYDMNYVWHGIDNNGIIFNEKDAESNIIGYDPATNMLTAPKNYVNPKDAKFGTKFPMSITYNYGKISNQAGIVKDYTPAWGESFTIELGNYVHDCTFTWKNAAPKVTYPGAVGRPSYIALSDLKITDWYNATLDLTKMNTTDTKENTYMKSVTLHFLTSDNKRIDEYYEFEGFTDKNDGTGTVTLNVTTSSKYIQMKSKSNASQGADVPTMIQLTFEDNFGYSVEVKMETPFIMTFQQ